jgi:hypothetical protein
VLSEPHYQETPPRAGAICHGIGTSTKRHSTLANPQLSMAKLIQLITTTINSHHSGWTTVPVLKYLSVLLQLIQAPVGTLQVIHSQIMCASVIIAPLDMVIEVVAGIITPAARARSCNLQLNLGSRDLRHSDCKRRTSSSSEVAGL